MKWLEIIMNANMLFEKWTKLPKSYEKHMSDSRAEIISV